MAHITKCGTKTDSERRMPQPTKEHSSDYKKEQELPGIKREEFKVLHQGKARTNQCPVDNAIGHIIELITQDQKEQEETQPFDRLFRHPGVQALQSRAQHIACTRPKTLQRRIGRLLNEERRWDSNDGSPPKRR